MLGQPHAVTIDGSHAWLIADPDTFGEVMTNVVDIAARARAPCVPGADGPPGELPTLVAHRSTTPRPRAPLR